MKDYSIMILAIVLALPGIAGSAGYVVKDGKPMAVICVPAGVGQPMQVATDELRTYIRKMSGSELAVETNAAPAGAGARIVLEVKPGTFSIVDGSDQGYTIEEKDELVRISGHSELGALFGVYQYLEDLGVRWYEPGEIGENVPEKKTIPIGARKKDYAPAFVTRSMETWTIPLDWINAKGEVGQPGFFTCKDDFEDYRWWRLRNRLQSCRNMGGILTNANREVAYCDESCPKFATAGADFAKEPERWCLWPKSGTDVLSRTTRQCCFSHEKNVSTAVEECVKYLKKNLDRSVAPMALSDNPATCLCEGCKKIGGEAPYYNERLVLTFMNKVAKGVGERLPGRGIALHFPYYQIQRVPPGMKLEPNLLAMACRATSWDASMAQEGNQAYLPFDKDYSEQITAISKAGAQMGFYDYILAGCPQPLTLLDVLPGYRKLGFRHCTSEIMNRSEQFYPLFWVAAKYTWAGEGDPREMLRTFCREYYGVKAGPDVYVIQETIDRNSRRAQHIIYGGLMDCSMMMPEAFIEEGMATLTRDIAQAGGKEKQRLERFRNTFEMFGRMARVYRTYCQALNERDPALVKALEKGCADFEAFWKANDMSRTCQQTTLKSVTQMIKTPIDLQATPKGRKELADRKVWMAELFAAEPGKQNVPADVPNLFPLPEIWKLRLDIAESGLKEGWEKPDYNDSKGWQPVSTWDCYENQGYGKVNGRFWYRVSFEAPKFPDGKKVMMRVGSLDDNGEVYLNGQLASKPNSIGMWDKSYAFEVTPFLKPGQKNVIAVRGYDSFGAGGIWRPCALYTE